MNRSHGSDGAASRPQLVATFTALVPVFLLAGPAWSQQKPTVTEGSLADVKFVESVPSGLPASSRLPLVIALHPQGGSHGDFLSFFGGLTSKARIVAPAADERNGLWSWYLAATRRMPARLACGWRPSASSRSLPDCWPHAA
jgi:hypothetical protein